MMTRNVRWFAALTVLLSLGIAGCGEVERKGYSYKGKITLNGAPITMDEDNKWGIVFTQTGGGDPNQGPGIEDALLEDGGAWTATVPAGSYRVEITCLGKDQKDKLGGNFAGANTPFKEDVSSSKSDVVYDVKLAQ